MDNMEMEVRKQLNLSQTNVKQDTKTLPTTCLTLEISVAITIRSKNEYTSTLHDKVPIDKGCTRTIIKQNNLLDKFFVIRKQLIEGFWTTNAGKLVTKYKIPLQFLFPEFAPSCKLSGM